MLTFISLKFKVAYFLGINEIKYVCYYRLFSDCLAVGTSDNIDSINP